MRVSVIMPVRNAETHCRQAIESILRQSYRDFEFIIVDDASNDGTLRVISFLKDKRIKLLRNKVRLGVARSLNLALTKAKGEFVARMDADDISLPERFSHQLDFLKKHPEIGVLGTAVEEIGGQDESLGYESFPKEHHTLVAHLAYTNPIRHPTVMFRKSLTDRWGGYDETLDGAEDYDLWMRLAKHTKLATLGEVLVKYRLSQSSVSFSDNQRIESAYLKAKIKSVIQYHYPLWHLVFAIKSAVSQLIPIRLKQRLYSRLFKY